MFSMFGCQFDHPFSKLWSKILILVLSQHVWQDQWQGLKLFSRYRSLSPKLSPIFRGSGVLVLAALFPVGHHASSVSWVAVCSILTPAVRGIVSRGAESSEAWRKLWLWVLVVSHQRDLPSIVKCWLQAHLGSDNLKERRFTNFILYENSFNRGSQETCLTVCFIPSFMTNWKCQD